MTTFEQGWIKGSIIRNLLLLSWPIIILNGLYGVSLTIEMIWVGKLGQAAIAGLGIASVVEMLVMSITMGICTGSRALIARFIGAGDVRSANHVGGQSFVISFAFSAFIAVIGIFFAEPIIGLFGVEAVVIAEGAAYLRIVLVGWVTMSFWMNVFGNMQASGDTVTPMKIAIFIRIIHAIICPFLVLGWWVFPRMGVGGAATANVAYQGLGCFIGLWMFFSRRTNLQLVSRDFCIDLNIVWRILKIGIPASIMGIQSAFSNILLAWFMAPFGTLAVAAHGMVSRIQQWVLMTGGGLARGGGILVGQNMGAGSPERAETSGWLAAAATGIWSVACLLIVLLWSENIIRIFNTEPDLVKLGGIFLRIAAVGFLAVVFVHVMQQCITGAGDTLPVMLISVVMLWVVLLPLALFLPEVVGLGVYGVRWAIVISMFVGALGYALYFRLGRWKLKKV